MDEKLLLMLANPQRRRKVPSKGYALVRSDDGLERVSLKGLEVGHFDSKVGTPRRSRKGRTYHAPNGYANYVPYGGSEVVAYKL
jgi:hypothetical protein